MAIFERGDTNDPLDPILQLFIIDGFSDPIDASYVGFRILDITTQKNKCYYAQQDFNKIQVYPGQGPEFIDVSKLTTDPVPGHKIATGNYYAPWTADPTLRVGEYIILWEWKVGATSSFRLNRMSFTVKEAS